MTRAERVLASGHGRGSTTRTERALVAVAVGAAGAVVAYAIQRAGERAFLAEPNPVSLIWADRSPFVWRAVISLYAGALAFFGGLALAARPARAVARGVLAITAAAALAVAAQAALAP